MRLLSFITFLSVCSGCASTAGGQTGEEQRRGDAGSSGGAVNGEPLDGPASVDPCAAGFEPDAPGETRYCAVVHAGLCFEGFEAGCACLGCPEGRCDALFSDPGQVSCDTGDISACEAGVSLLVVGDGPCEAIALGLCFEDPAEACACGGCGYPCGMTRSAPGQVIPCDP